MPYSLPVGMGFTLMRPAAARLSRRTSRVLLLAAALVGIGSSIFHPESSRVARMASGGRHGLAQSLFQVGGNTGSALGPLVAAAVIVPHGQTQRRVVRARRRCVGIVLLLQVEPLVRAPTRRGRQRRGRGARGARHAAARAACAGAIAVLLVLIFSKYFYLASLSSYYTFYLIDEVRPVGAERAGAPVRVPRRRRPLARCSAARSATASAASR